MTNSSPMNNKTIMYFVIASIIFINQFGIASSAFAQSKQKRENKVEVEIAKLATLATFIQVEAQIVANSASALNAPLTALLTMEPLRIGSMVKQGQVIAQQDTNDLVRKSKRLRLSAKSETIAIAQLEEQIRFEASLLANATRQIDLQKNILARVTELSDRQIIAKEQIDAAELSLLNLQQKAIQHEQAIARMHLQIESAKARQDQYYIDLDETAADINISILKSPATGQLISVPGSREQYYKEGDEVAIIRTSSDFEIEADIPVSLLAYLRDADIIEGKDATGVSLNARVRAELPAENQRTATRSVRFDIVSPLSEALKAEGARVTMEIPSGAQEQSVTTSIDALIPFLDRAIIFIAEEGRAVRREVSIGNTQGERVAITSGLEIGQMVITKGNEGLRDGSPITIISAP